MNGLDIDWDDCLAQYLQDNRDEYQEPEIPVRRSNSVTFWIGTERSCFTVPRALILRSTSMLITMVYAQQEAVELRDTSIETFALFLDYLCTGTYKIRMPAHVAAFSDASETGHVAPKLESRDYVNTMRDLAIGQQSNAPWAEAWHAFATNEAYGSSVLGPGLFYRRDKPGRLYDFYETQMRLYLFATKYSVAGLDNLALWQLHQYVSVVTCVSRAELIDIVELVLNNTTKNSDRLRVLTLQFVAFSFDDPIQLYFDTEDTTERLATVLRPHREFSMEFYLEYNRQRGRFLSAVLRAASFP